MDQATLRPVAASSKLYGPTECSVRASPSLTAVVLPMQQSRLRSRSLTAHLHGGTFITVQGRLRSRSLTAHLHGATFITVQGTTRADGRITSWRLALSPPVRASGGEFSCTCTQVWCEVQRDSGLLAGTAQCWEALEALKAAQAKWCRHLTAAQRAHGSTESSVDRPPQTHYFIVLTAISTTSTKD